MYYTNRYLMFEISTIFVDFHWFFAKVLLAAAARSHPA